MFNGSALVAENGRVIYRKGFGYADFDWNLPNAPDTKFRIGSITKQFSAMLIMQLVEKGKIRLDGNITDYLPNYRKDTGGKVTIHHLLTHTSGIPTYTGLPGFWSDSTRNPYPIEDVVTRFCSGDLEFEPGSMFRYNNSGYYILGYIIEKVTGMPFGKGLEENILKPVKMFNTGLEDESRILNKRAAGYVKRVDHFVREPYFFMQNAYSAGAMYSTVEDLYLWDQALYGTSLLSKTYKDLYFYPHIPSGGGNYYAYGWGTGKVPVGKSGDSVMAVSHGGGINGFNTIIFRIPDSRHLVVLLNNTGPAKLYEMSVAVTSILSGKPFNRPKVSIVNTLFATTLRHGVNAAVQQYRTMKASQDDMFDFGENELNTLGYQLLRSERRREAIAVFVLNVQMFPEAFNPYDSLGEAYMMDGQKELAIKNYAKSLELNPKNASAIVMLKRISEMK